MNTTINRTEVIYKAELILRALQVLGLGRNSETEAALRLVAIMAGRPAMDLARIELELDFVIAEVTR